MNDAPSIDILPRDEIDAYREALSKPSPRCIRLRPDRESFIQLPADLDVVPWFQRGRLLRNSRLRPSQSLQYAAADYYIQDAGSLLALALLSVQPGELICDLCAAPGGKASGIVELLGEGGFLLANEPIGSRTAILRYALSRTGSPRYAVTQQDPDQIASRFAGLFDAVLVDAPCSGQSMVARGKRDRNAFDAKQVQHSARRQQRILLAACRLLKPGGRLIYSTCTFSVEENEAQIRFLQLQFPDAWEPIRASALERWASPIESGCYRLWPHREPTAGAFAAGLILKESISRESAASTPSVHSSVRSNRSLTERGRLFSNGAERIAEFGRPLGMNFCQAVGGDVFAIAADIPIELTRRLDEHEWPKLAKARNGVTKPEYALAMLGSAWFDPFRGREVTDPQAQKYMLGEAFSMDESWLNDRIALSGADRSANQPPWFVIFWYRKPLGWAKLAAARFNNHLPKLAVLAIGITDEFAT